MARVGSQRLRRLGSALRRALGGRRQEQEEDALKHLCLRDDTQVPGTAQSVAGALDMTADDAAAVLDRLVRRGLVRWQGEVLRLTEAGQQRALQVIRAHRLWERHLADRTGVDAPGWHRAAERAEHELTPQETDRLSARLGHPAFDPHGDPIPAADGRWPRRPPTLPLDQLREGSHGLIAHIEDEPEGVFRRLADLGLHAGAEIERLDDTGDGALRLRRADGAELALSPAEAASLSLQPLAEAGGGEIGLADVPPGAAARVRRLAPDCRGLERRRLLDLGIVPGSYVIPEWRAATGDPTAYRVRGSLVALRREQAARVLVSPVEATR